MADVVQLVAGSLPSSPLLSANSARFSPQLGLGLGLRFPPLRSCGMYSQKQHLVCCAPEVSASHFWRARRRFPSFKVHAVVAETEKPKWWERSAGPNMIDIHSTQEYFNALGQAGDKLVIVEFYGTWCGSCRALFPKLCKIAEEHPDILFLKVNFDENKPMCKSLNVRVLPYFHFYRGADGQLESFSCSLAKFQKLKDAIATHNTARCSIGPPLGVGDNDLLGAFTPKDKPAEATTR